MSQQRKRKRGRGGASVGARPAGTAVRQARPAPEARPAAPAARTRREPESWVERYSARAEIKNAEARENLIPLARNEHPWPLLVAIGLALVFSLGTLALMIAGVRVDNRPPSASWGLYVIVMFACAVGMLRHWFQAVLAFMCLLGIALVIFCGLLLRFSNFLGFIIPLVVVILGGTLFWKLVRVLSRLQMPQRPGAASRG